MRSTAVLMFVTFPLALAAAEDGFYREFRAGPMPEGRFRVNSPEAVLHPEFGKRFEAKRSGMLEGGLERRPARSRMGEFRGEQHPAGADDRGPSSRE